MSPIFIDTNILLYSISFDPREDTKKSRAQDILNRADCALSIQVLQEFYVQVTRVTSRKPLSSELAIGLIRSWMRFPIQDMTADILFAAFAIRATNRFSYWDSAVIAAAQALGCRELFTEDLSHGQIIGGLHIVNPFL